MGKSIETSSGKELPREETRESRKQQLLQTLLRIKSLTDNGQNDLSVEDSWALGDQLMDEAFLLCQSMLVRGRETVVDEEVCESQEQQIERIVIKIKSAITDIRSNRSHEDIWSSYDRKVMLLVLLVCIMAVRYGKEEEEEEEGEEEERAPKRLKRLVQPESTWIGYFNDASNGGDYQRNLRMKISTFFSLESWLTANTSLKDSTNVTAREKLVIFLFIIGQGSSNQAAAKRFTHSTKTISRYFEQVLEAMMHLHRIFIPLPISDFLTLASVSTNSQFMPYFEDCLGVLSSICIPTSVSPTDRERYQNEKGIVSQKFFAACHFNGRFAYIIPGWEGSATDRRVLQDVERQYYFTTPPGKYWLGDTAYSSSKSLLVPYPKAQCHLKENGPVEEKPQNHMELFNLRHASLHKAMESNFRVLKRRFQILETGSTCSVSTQSQIIFATTAIHNFIVKREGMERVDIDEEENDNRGESTLHDRDGNKQMKAFRDRIARRMWRDYQTRACT